MGGPSPQKEEQRPIRSDENHDAASLCTSDEDQVDEIEEEPTAEAELEIARREMQTIMQEASATIVLQRDSSTICEGSPCLVDEDPTVYEADALKYLLLYRLLVEWPDGQTTERSVYHVPCLEHLLDLRNHTRRLILTGSHRNALYAPLLHRWKDRRGRIDTARELEYIERETAWMDKKSKHDVNHKFSRSAEHRREGCSSSCAYQEPKPELPLYTSDDYACTLSTVLPKPDRVLL